MEAGQSVGTGWLTGLSSLRSLRVIGHLKGVSARPAEGLDGENPGLISLLTSR